MTTTTTTRFPLRRTLEGHRALLHLKAMRRAVTGWDAYAAAMYRQGYRPERCIHGRYQWTDYDPICGGCEDGVLASYDLHQQALEAGKADAAEFERRIDLVNALTARGHSSPPEEVLVQLRTWAVEPVRLTNVPDYGWSEYLHNAVPLVRRAYCTDVRCDHERFA